MATCYTSYIKKGVSFREFVLKCARAMGACVTMRDDPLDEEIPDKFKPSDYYSKKLIEVRRRRKRLDTISSAEATKGAKKQFNDNKKYALKRIDEIRELETKYKSMLKQVEMWTPPTIDHQDLKDFMVSQIKDSIQFDCNVSYYKQDLDKATLLSGEEWLEREKSSLDSEIESLKKHDAEEKYRTEERNQWIRELRESLEEYEN